MIIKNVSLETVCGITSKLPENIHPEVASVSYTHLTLPTNREV